MVLMDTISYKGTGGLVIQNVYQFALSLGYMYIYSMMSLRKKTWTSPQIKHLNHPTTNVFEIEIHLTDVESYMKLYEQGF